MFDGRPMQMVQKDIAALGVVMVGLAGSILEQDMAIDAHFRGARRRLPRVIRLRRSLRQYDVGTLRPGLGEQEFELARFVAAGGHSGAVVAFDPDFRSLERPAQVRQVFERRRQMGEANSRKSCKVHYLLTFKNGIGAPA